MKEIWVAGFPAGDPSKKQMGGGADSELSNQIDLWRSYDVDVNLVPMFGADANARQYAIQRGCKIHDYKPDVFKNKIVVSYCNGEFLEKLVTEIQDKGRPAMVCWANCMTYCFPREIEAHRNGLIDLFLFISNYQESILRPQLEVINPVMSRLYKVYTNPDVFNFQPGIITNEVILGRISRDDGNKFAEDTFEIFDRIAAPRPKRILILGFGSNAKNKLGDPVGCYELHKQGGISSEEFYRRTHIMVHKTGGSGESYCRVLIEAYATGTVAVVEDDFAFPELVQHGKTAYLCRSSDDFVYYASKLAYEKQTREKIASLARRYLENEISNREKCWDSVWKEIL